MRRIFKRRGGGGGGGGSGGSGVRVSYPPLPTSVTPLWEFHSESQLTPTSWTDSRVSGRVLANTGAPTVGVDGAFFNGRPVAQANSTGYWANRALPTIAAAGVQLWWYAVARFQSTSAASIGLGAGRSGNDALTLRTQAGSPVTRDVLANQTVTIANGFGELTPRKYIAWLDGTNGHFMVDGVDATAAVAGGINQAVQALAVGTAAQGDFGTAGKVSLAYWLACNGKPSAAEIAALDAWSLAQWAV